MEKDKKLCKKEKKNKLHKYKKIYKPNTILYLILSSIFTVIVAIIFFILCCNLDSDPCVAICSALISILGGALASVATAWLIDVFQCKAKNKSIIKQGETSIKYLHSSLDDLFQSFANSYCGENENVESQKWEYWLDYLATMDFYRDCGDFYDRMLDIYVSLNMVISETERLCNSELRQYTESVYSDLTQFQLLSTACKQLNKTIFNNGNENLSFIKYKIGDFLSTIVAFWDIEEKKYGPTKCNSESKGDVSCEA